MPLPDELTVEQPETRRCAVCDRERPVIATIGPLKIKEPCENRCGSGYTKPGKAQEGK